VAGSPGRAGAPKAEARTLDWPVILAVLVLAALVRALRIWSVLTWQEDDVLDAIPAIQILHGTFPLFHVAVEYAGASKAYLLALWFALAGTSTAALEAFGYLIGLAGVWTSILVARRLLPPGAALFAGLVLAVPSLHAVTWAIGGNLLYPATILLGNLLLLLSHAVFFRAPGRPGLVLVTGVVAGLSWWTNPLLVVFCVPFALLAVRTGLVWRATVWLFPLGMLVGGLPDWIYEVVNYPSARLLVGQSGSLPAEPFVTRLRGLLGEILPRLYGASVEPGFAPPLAVRAAVMGIGVLAIARAAVRDRASLRWLAGRGGAPDGLVLLWGVFLANVLVVLATKRPLGANYLVPLYAVLPLWTGECLWWLGGRRRWLGGVALAALLGIHLWANWAVTLGRSPHPTWRWASAHAIARPLADWLVARGMRHVYWAPDGAMPAHEFTYLSGMRVIAANLWAEAVIQHAHAVDAVDAPPIVTSAGRLATLRGTLHGLGLDFRETAVGGFVVLEASAAPPRGFAPLPASGWTLTASHRAHELHYLVDRDAGTAWSTGQRQAPGQWLQVDLGAPQEVARVDLLAIDWKEVPAGIQVGTSEDGARWSTAVAVPEYWGPFFWSERHAFLKVRRGRVQLTFAPVRTRFLRLTQTGIGHQAWAARELFVYRPAPPAPAGLEPGALGAALRQEGVRFVYANHWLSSRARVESDESIGALESNAALNSYGRSEPEPSTLERFRPRRDRAVLLGSDADGAAVREVLAGRRAVARERAVGPYRLLVLAPDAAKRSLARSGWRAQASLASNFAGQAVDGDPRTRWMALGPVDSATTFTLDLGQPQPLAGLRLTPGSREGGPADFALEGSEDGQTWRPLEPRTWAGPLYWTGAELLRNSRPEWAVRIPPTTARYVRIRPAAPARTWIIAEITALE
jgi:F5/8 type C domain-containing protein